MEQNIKRIVEQFCRENNIMLKLSYDMPAGYETAFGTYDVTINTLFLNLDILKDSPAYEILYYLFHELRHALQYQCPGKFDDQIQESRFYVILYNGGCYKLHENQWEECSIGGSENYFANVYKNLFHKNDITAAANHWKAMGK